MAADRDAGYFMPLDDALDPAVLVRHVWFALTFDDYVAMRLVSRRWRRLYIAARQDARRHFFRYRFQGDGECWDRDRVFINREGREVVHGERKSRRLTVDGFRYWKVAFRMGERDRWGQMFCAACKEMTSITLGNDEIEHSRLVVWIRPGLQCPHVVRNAASDIQAWETAEQQQRLHNMDDPVVIKHRAVIAETAQLARAHGLATAFKLAFGARGGFNEADDDAPQRPPAE